MADWLVVDGETGSLLRDYDWCSTPLGSLQCWPQSLRTAVNFMIAARQPVYIAWGTELWSMYNDSYLPIVGEKHPAGIGKTFQALWPEIWEEYRPYVEAVMAGQAQFWVDQPVVLAGRPNRPIGWFTFSWTPLRDEEGAVAGFVCVGSETTERILAEHQLVESMDEGFCVIEIVLDEHSRPVDYRFIRSNPAFAQQTGLENAEGRLVTELVPGIEQHWIESYGQVALTSQPMRFVNEASSMGRWFDVYAFRIVGSSNRVGILFRDITESKVNEEKLRDADRQKDEFLAMLAHELRNPLAPIGVAAELLQVVKMDEARVRQTCQIIDRQVKHMTSLVDDLLDVSRVTRGSVELNDMRLDIGHVVTDAIEQVMPLIRSRRHHLNVQMTPGMHFVMGDKKRLVQVIVNLLNNAAKYTHEGGQLLLRTEMHRAHVIIQIIDNGIGMASELVARAFDLFAQAERTSDRASGGLGLGLALVRSLVSLHRGTVTCESAGLGHGSTFTVCLPRMPVDVRQSNSQREDTPPRESGKPLRILVVDDNVDAASMLSMLLEAGGHEVLIEYGAHGALERAKSEAPEVCILDIGLPEMDGNRLAQHLRTLPETAESVLIAVTGYGQEKDRQQTLSAGFDHHLVKPVDTKKLAAILAETVNNV